MPAAVTAFFAEAIAGRETGSPAYTNGTIADPGVLPDEFTPQEISRPTTSAACREVSTTKACD